MLNSKTVIVTGAGSGIGKASAQHFAKVGARVVVADISEGGEAVAAAIRAAGGEAAFARVDVSDESSVKTMVAFAVERFGRLDGAFNNAGIEFHGRLIPDLGFDEWRKVLGVNLDGVFLCMKHQIAAMRETGGGAIVNTASAAAVAAPAVAAEYTASKAAVAGLTRAAATETSETKVRVNAILPGLILTEMTEKRLFVDNEEFAKAIEGMKIRHGGRFGTPDDVARAACWLLSDECPFVNGASLAVDGGYTAR